MKLLMTMERLLRFWFSFKECVCTSWHAKVEAGSERLFRCGREEEERQEDEHIGNSCLAVSLQLLNKRVQRLQLLLINKVKLEDEEDEVLEASVQVCLSAQRTNLLEV